jgi:hypothetical protein
VLALRRVVHQRSQRHDSDRNEIFMPMRQDYSTCACHPGQDVVETSTCPVRIVGKYIQFSREEFIMNIQKIGFWIILAFLWIMMILLGAIILETFMVYPNIFHNPPQSLALGLEFMSVRAPNDFFPPLGFLSWVTGLAALIFGWRVKSARWWILGSLLMIVGEGVASILLFWPRNTIMFVEGPAVHSADFLIQTAQEFETMHWLRLAFNLLGSAMIFTGFLKYYRHLLTSRLPYSPT